MAKKPMTDGEAAAVVETVLWIVGAACLFYYLW